MGLNILRQNLENKRVRRASTLDICSCLIADIFGSAELGDADMLGPRKILSA